MAKSISRRLYSYLYDEGDCWAQKTYPGRYSHLDSATIAYCQGDIRPSIRCLERFLKFFSKDALFEEATLCLGEIYQEEKDFALAIPSLKSVLKFKDSGLENYIEGKKYQPNFDTLFPFGEDDIPTCVQLAICPGSSSFSMF